jgi:hypothetical protein
MTYETKTNQNRHQLQGPSPALLARKEQARKEHVERLKSGATKVTLGVAALSAAAVVLWRGGNLPVNSYNNVKAESQTGSTTMIIGELTNQPSSEQTAEPPDTIASYASMIARQESKDEGGPVDSAEVTGRLQEANPDINVFKQQEPGTPFNIPSQDRQAVSELTK